MKGLHFPFSFTSLDSGDYTASTSSLGKGPAISHLIKLALQMNNGTVYINASSSFRDFYMLKSYTSSFGSYWESLVALRGEGQDG